MTSTDQQHRLPGTDRAARFAEPDDVPSDFVPPVRVLNSEVAAQLPNARPTPVPEFVSYRPAPAKEAPAEFGRRAKVLRLLSCGLAKPKPGRVEYEHRRCVRIIRDGHWDKSIRVMIASPKGGVGKTPAALILAGILASVRGGSVAVWDACDAAGTLHDRAGGRQVRCVSEIALYPERFPDPAAVSACAATQTSFADVLGSLRERAFTDESVNAVTSVLDVTHRIQIADTANTPHSSAYQAVLERADILVIPTTLTADSINKALGLLCRVQESPDHLGQRAVVVLSLVGGPVTAAEAHELFKAAGVGAVIEVPFDQHIAAGVEIDLAELSHQSRLAWTRVGASVVANVPTN
jgi:MinD-like ATPase involved in chromosome partitioning or flagellar assembly